MEDAHRILLIMRTGAWLSVIPAISNGTELGAQKWGDYLFLRYGINLTDLPDHCNRCGSTFEICPALLGLRWRWHFNLSPYALPKSRSNHTHVPAVMWRVGFQSLLYGKRTAVSGGSGLRPNKLAWNSPNGRTERTYTSLGKQSGIAHPHQLTSHSFHSHPCLEKNMSRTPGISQQTQLMSKQGMSLSPQWGSTHLPP